MIDILIISYEIPIVWKPQDLANDWPTLVQLNGLALSEPVWAEIYVAIWRY